MLKGYIEGYYGRLFSQEERAKVINHMAKLNMDFYIYGPKEDPYHRVSWEENYPPETERILKSLVDQCKKNKISPVFSLSPGLKISKSTKVIKNYLLAKFRQARKMGFEDFAIFFDDIEHKRDKNLAESHLRIIELVQSFDVSKDSKITICPTVYCTSFAKGDIKNNEYLKSLSEGIDPSISIMWTGKEVVSQSISKKDLKELKDLFSNPIIIWDNYYANDYCPSRFYIGPHSGRKTINNEVQGIGINPTGLPVTDMICLSRFVADKSTREILKEFKIPREFIKVLPYFTNPFKNLPSLDDKNIDAILNTKETLCIEWKSELQLEWAPFLWKFYLDLILLKKIKNEDNQFNLEEWLKRRYSDPLKKIILRN